MAGKGGHRQNPIPGADLGGAKEKVKSKMKFFTKGVAEGCHPLEVPEGRFFDSEEWFPLEKAGLPC